LIRIATIWGERGTEFREHFDQHFNQPLARYSSKETLETRVKALSDIFKSLLTQEALKWWFELTARAIMVQFYAGVDQELTIRRAW